MDLPVKQSCLVYLFIIVQVNRRSLLFSCLLNTVSEDVPRFILLRFALSRLLHLVRAPAVSRVHPRLVAPRLELTNIQLTWNSLYGCIPIKAKAFQLSLRCFSQTKPSLHVYIWVINELTRCSTHYTSRLRKLTTS